MDSQPIPPADDRVDTDSLEGSAMVVEATPSDANSELPPLQNATTTPPITPNNSGGEPPKTSTSQRFKRWFKSLNVYLLLFVLVLLLAVISVIVAAASAKHNQQGNLNTTSLSQNTLRQLANSDATVGNSAQVLNVQSSAVFAGKVLIRDDLEVAGNLQVGGSLALNSLSVAGTGSFDQLQVAKNLAVAGDTAIQGVLTAQQGLNVKGNSTFSGNLSAAQISANSLQLSGDLLLTHHISAGGATPGRSNGTALGNGGTSSVSGSDTSGTLSINTGSNPASGCFATITFSQKYNSTPHVIVTPIGSAAAGLAYYVNRSTSSFSICTNSQPPASTSFAFDYVVLD